MNGGTCKGESEHLKKVPISGYLHETTPLKTSRNNFTYFNFKFQTQSGLCDGVCFEKSIYNQVKQKEETQKSVRLSNYSLKRSLHDNSEMTIVINKRTKLENTFQCSFDHKAPQTIFRKIIEIKDISDFSLVSVVGKVHIRSEPCEVKVKEHSVMKLDCNVGDDTSAIKLTLWDKNISLVKEGEVYEIVNARVRSYQGEKYLSINSDSIISGAKSDAEKMTVVPEVMNDEQLISVDTIIINKIGGVQEIQRYAVCSNCRRKLNNLQSDICVCDVCGLNQIVTVTDQAHFSAAILIKELDNTILRVLQDEVKSFLKLYNEEAESCNTVDLVSATDSQIIIALLSARDLKITYNTKTKLVASILYNK